MLSLFMCTIVPSTPFTLKHFCSLLLVLSLCTNCYYIISNIVDLGVTVYLVIYLVTYISCYCILLAYNENLFVSNISITSYFPTEKNH